MHRPMSCTLLLTWALLFWGCGGNGSPSGPAAPDGGSSQVADTLFADRGLEAAVRTALDRPEGTISQKELSSLKSLDAHGLGMKDLSGIGQLDSLQSLDLADNEVSDLTPLATLIRLEYLDLSNNHLTEVAALASLAQLKVLVLEQNAVEDLSPLQGLSHLERLELTEGTIVPSATVELEARGVEVVWAMAEEPSSPGGVPGPLAGAGPRIAFTVSTGQTYDALEIWVMAPDGSNPFSLITNASHPAWSPDGTQLAFIRYGGSDDVYVLRSGEVSPAPLAQERGRDESWPSWSPDGSRIAYMRGRDIWIMKADGSEQVNLTQHPDDDFTPSWSPDGQRIVFASSRDRADLRGYSDIFQMDADGGNVVRLTRHSSDNLGPSFSPDGTRIAFLSNRENHAFEVYTMDVDGNQLLKLSSLGGAAIGGRPTWSPDGQRIICSFASGIWSLAPDGSDQILLLERRNVSDPVWTADAAMDLAGIEEKPRFFSNARLERAVLAHLVGVTREAATEADLLTVTAVSCQDCGIRDLTGIEKLNSLKVLVLSNGTKDSTAVPDETWNQLGDLSPLAGLVELQSLSLAVGPKVDLLPLAQLGELTSLEMTGDGIEDLSPLSHLVKLKKMTLTSDRLQDLRPLSGLKALTHLYLRGSHIGDLAPLAALSELVDLLVNGGQVRDLTPLSHLAHLYRLDLYKNQVEDLSPLSGMVSLVVLTMRSNQIQEVAPLLALPSLRSVWLWENPLRDKAREVDIPALRERGVLVGY